MRPTRREVNGAIVSGALLGLSGCLGVFSSDDDTETPTEVEPDQETEMPSSDSDMPPDLDSDERVGPDDRDEGTPVSDPVDTSFSQTYNAGSASYTAQIRVMSMGDADAIVFVVDGEDVETLTSSTEPATISGLSAGDNVRVEAQIGESREHQETYTIIADQS